MITSLAPLTGRRASPVLPLAASHLARNPSLRLALHSTHPQPRLVARAVERLRAGALALLPTDSGYALIWTLDDREAQARVLRLRKLDARHNFTLLCRDLSEVASYARVDDSAYRLMRRLTPGPYTFVLPASKQLPKRLANERKRTVGIRVPAHPVSQAVLAELREPLSSSTLLLPDAELEAMEPEQIFDRVEPAVDLIIDSGVSNLRPTTVLDLSGGTAELLRLGAGPWP